MRRLPISLLLRNPTIRESTSTFPDAIRSVFFPGTSSFLNKFTSKCDAAIDPIIWASRETSMNFANEYMRLPSQSVVNLSVTQIEPRLRIDPWLRLCQWARLIWRTCHSMFTLVFCWLSCLCNGNYINRHDQEILMIIVSLCSLVATVPFCCVSDIADRRLEPLRLI